MIIGNTNFFSTQLSAAVTGRPQCVEAAQGSAAAADDRRGASPGRGGVEGGDVRVTAAPFAAADANPHSTLAMGGQQSAAVEALLFALIGQHMQARMSTQASRY